MYVLLSLLSKKRHQSFKLEGFKRQLLRDYSPECSPKIATKEFSRQERFPWCFAGKLDNSLRTTKPPFFYTNECFQSSSRDRAVKMINRRLSHDTPRHVTGC